MKVTNLVAIILMVMAYQLAAGQSSNYFGEKEVTPKIPPKGERMRVIIVSDATNEIDDVWAISLDRDKVFHLFYSKLKEHYGNDSGSN